MKKLFLFMLALLLVFQLCSCKREESQAAYTSGSTGETDNAIKEPEYETIYLCSRMTNFDDNDNVDTCFEYKYDDDLNIVEQIISDPSADIRLSIKTEYDSNGYKTKESHTETGDVGSWTEYEYDINNHLVKEISYSSDGSVIDWYEYEYNTEGYATRGTWYDADGSMNHWYKCEYDTDGNMTKRIYYKPDGSVSTTYEYVRNINGEVIKETTIKDHGFTAETTYTYDNKGNKVKEYFEINKNTSEAIVYWYDYKNEYDSYGNLTKTIQTSDEGTVLCVSEYDYITVTREKSE